jgi:Domain of unknown function (DUF4440)
MTGEIDNLFRRYGDLFLAGDAEAIADMWHAPFTAIRGGTPVHLADRAEAIAHVTALMDGFRASGAIVADIGRIDVRSQGDSATLATVHWTLKAATGKTLREFKTTYQLVGPDPWLIVSYVNHDTVRS